MSARCETCGRFAPYDTHSIKLHGKKCQEAYAQRRAAGSFAAVCKNCGKQRGLHKAGDLRCPAGPKTRCGYITYSSTTAFEPFSIEGVLK